MPFHEKPLLSFALSQRERKSPKSTRQKKDIHANTPDEIPQDANSEFSRKAYCPFETTSIQHNPEPVRPPQSTQLEQNSCSTKSCSSLREHWETSLSYKAGLFPRKQTSRPTSTHITDKISHLLTITSVQERKQ